MTMPRYAFRCTVCELEFEVSRSMRDATSEATCPTDGEPATRIFTMPATNFNRPTPTTPTPPGARGYSHFGHSHGPGASSHSH